MTQRHQTYFLGSCSGLTITNLEISPVDTNSIASAYCLLNVYFLCYHISALFCPIVFW